MTVCLDGGVQRVTQAAGKTDFETAKQGGLWQGGKMLCGISKEKAL